MPPAPTFVLMQLIACHFAQSGVVARIWLHIPHHWGRKDTTEMLGGIGELILIGWLGLIVWLVYKLAIYIGSFRNKG